MPSGKWLNVLDYNEARCTYLCAIDVDDIDGYATMSAAELAESRYIEFTQEFLLKHCKEKR